MKSFSASDVAVTGFQVAKEQPKVIGIWAVTHLLLSLSSALVMVSLGGEAMAQFLTLAQSPSPDPMAIMAVYGQLAPMYGVLILIMLAYYSIVLPAGYRVILRPAESAFGYLRLGAAEGRQFVVNLVLGIVLFFAYFGAAVIAGIIAGILGAVLSAVAGAGASAVIVVVVVFAIFIAVWAPIATRLSLAGPQTLDEGQIRLFDSWALTKGHVKSMLGAYVLSFILALVVTLLGLVIVFGAAAALGGGMAGLKGIMQPDLSSLGAYFNPLMVIYLVMMSVISAMSLAITLTPPAVIYRNLRKGGLGADLDAFE